MGYRGRKTLLKQWLSRSRPLVTEQEREHRVCRSELAAVSEESRGQVSIAQESVGTFPSARFWHDSRTLKVLGMGTALPGPPVSTAELLERVEKRFGVAVVRRGSALANRLKIATRHICRDFEARREVPRRGHSNPVLPPAALRVALDEAGLEGGDLAYPIG